MNQATIKLSKGLRDIANQLDSQIEQTAGERLGFAVVVFTEGRASYISNCDRSDVVQQLTNLLELWAEGMPDIPAHDVSG